MTFPTVPQLSSRVTFPDRPCEARDMAKRWFRIDCRESFPRPCAFRAAARLKAGFWTPPYNLGNSASLHD